MTTLAVAVNGFGFAAAADRFVGGSAGGTATAEKLIAPRDGRPVAALWCGNSRPLGLAVNGLLGRWFARHPTPADRFAIYAEGFLDYLRAELNDAAADMDPPRDHGPAAKALRAATDVGWSADMWAERRRSRVVSPDLPDGQALTGLADELLNADALVVGKALACEKLPDDPAHRLAVVLGTLSDIGRRRCGVVFVGCGEHDRLAEIHYVEIVGAARGRLLYQATREGADTGAFSPVLAGYAQTDVIDTFRSGVAADVRSGVQRAVDTLLRDVTEGKAEHEGWRRKRRAAFDEAFDAAVRRGHVEPLERSLAVAMPRELAAVTVNLVALTAFQRTLRERAPTVAGPFDACHGHSGGMLVRSTVAGTLV
ncbi:MAG: hypothetical protein WKF96_01675 [Solirubrobacteraceae bacterium]